MAQLINETIGEYRIIAFLAAGGMGDVYRAEHMRIGRQAVVKTLRCVDLSDANAQRFLNEAKIQSDLVHPNIAVLYEFNLSPGYPCIIMEYIDGEMLSDMIIRLESIPIKDALRLFAQIVETIQFIHQNGIIHRDIKPENIKINSKGQVKLLDFGISKAAFTRAMTGEGKLIGTQQYLAPEQLNGEPATFQTDIWSLGALFYEMITGKVAFEANTITELYKKISSADYTPAHIFKPEISKDARKIIDSCLRKNPSQRYPSCTLLRTAILDCSISADSCSLPWFNRLYLYRWKISRATAYTATLLISLFFIFRAEYFFEDGQGSLFSEVNSSAKIDQPHNEVEGNNIQSAIMSHLSTPATQILTHSSVQGELREIRIDVNANGGPSAQVTVAVDNRSVGTYPTPYINRFPEGSIVQYLLKREGFKDCRGEFNVKDSYNANQHWYQMCESSKNCADSKCK